MQIWDAKEKGEIFKYVVECLFKTIFTNRFKNVFERFKKCFFKFGYLENAVNNDVIAISDRIIVSFQDESICFGNNWILFTLFLTNFTTLKNLYDEECVIGCIGDEVDEILETILGSTHRKSKWYDNYCYPFIKQSIFDYFQSMKRHVIAFNMIKSSFGNYFQVFFYLFQQTYAINDGMFQGNLKTL